MKTFKIFYEWRVGRCVFQRNFSFEKASTKQQAIDQFKSEFLPEVEFNITSVMEC